MNLTEFWRHSIKLRFINPNIFFVATEIFLNHNAFLSFKIFFSRDYNFFSRLQSLSRASGLFSSYFSAFFWASQNVSNFLNIKLNIFFFVYLQEDIPKIPANKVNSAPGMDWSVKPTEKAKYDQLFDSLQPTNGVIPGSKVRGVLTESKLPFEMLGKIWDLADLDKDGSLNRHEFMIAMHLVYKALEKHTIPNTLPPELMPPGKRKDSSVSPSNLITTPPAKVRKIRFLKFFSAQNLKKFLFFYF